MTSVSVSISTDAPFAMASVEKEMDRLNASLKTPAPDLTKIQKNNRGVFPFDRIYRVIDGREAVAAHGPRDMPVWGNENTVDLITGFRVNAKELESYIRGRIIALIGYIYNLQDK